jgi:hypothetical protein
MQVSRPGVVYIQETSHMPSMAGLCLQRDYIYTTLSSQATAQFFWILRHINPHDRTGTVQVRQRASNAVS